MRVLHFSDVHIQASLGALSASDWFSKRAVGAANLLARRGKYFRSAALKLEQLEAFRRAEGAPMAVCTGDYTALGTEEEHALARLAVAPLTEGAEHYLTVPGNHDLYLADTLADGRFDRHFGELVTSDWPDRSVDGPWPWVRLFGDSLAVVGINSARPNPNPVRSSGLVPGLQLEALAGVLADRRLVDRWVLVLSHYGLLRQDGAPDSPHHGLENADALAAVCRRHPRAVILHGHVHWRYFHPATADRPPSFGAGSATHEGREGAWILDVERDALRATACGFEAGRYITLPGSSVAVTPAPSH